MYVYMYHIQKTTIKVGSAIYKLGGIVKYQNRHYSSLIRSTENNIQWFYKSVTLMYVQKIVFVNIINY